MNSGKLHLSPTPEREPSRLSPELEEVVKVEALRKAELLGDDFAQLAEVIGGRLPGSDIAEYIAILKKIDFGSIGGFEAETEYHVTEAIRCFSKDYARAIAETIEDLNRLLESKQGAFSIHGIENGTLVSLDIRPDEQQILRLYLQTAGGVISPESAILDIDLTKI